MTKAEKLESINDKIWRLQEAIRYLSDVGECEDLIDALNDKVIVLSFMQEEYSRLVYEEARKTEAELTREYWRSVL